LTKKGHLKETPNSNGVCILPLKAIFSHSIVIAHMLRNWLFDDKTKEETHRGDHKRQLEERKKDKINKEKKRKEKKGGKKKTVMPLYHMSILCLS
jgi:hypothetical protein